MLFKIQAIIVRIIELAAIANTVYDNAKYLPVRLRDVWIF
jgi:hypothetical protein